ncbi:MAG: thiamine-phosphate kinase [Verrucomicrobiales bacterium]|nr:thiamine-phosphate kinase [Verrucomicrobiales bacterium]|tara:strand:- start:3754 stop:4692 length:939 start_codon:yes stop_codon:yes gene_type:complete
MNEFELIRELTKNLHTHEGVAMGVGDDCAILNLGAEGKSTLFKTDAIVESVHFDRNADAAKVGRKALARCLSDIAAMAGRPLHAVVTLGLPEDFDPGYITRIYAGMNELAAEYNVAIVGGETTNNGDRLLINVAVIGEVESGKAVLRTGAQAGDAIFVSGELGGSLAGKHFEFTPRLKEAAWLASSGDVHAMIDLSDGLAGDLKHLVEASGVGAELMETSIPISRAAKLRYRGNETSKPPVLAALTDGEDFELLFTVSRADAVKILDGWKKEFPDTPITCIGKITSGSELQIKGERGKRNLTESGFVHFSPN